MNKNSPHLSSTLLTFLQQQDDVQEIQVPAGVPVCQSGDYCKSLVIILEGQVKVYRPAENGHSLTLYHVNNNESCILTASCILNEMPFPAYAKTVTEVKALSIPPQKVKQWLAQEPVWQKYVFGLLSQRMVGLIDLVNALAFQGLDVRLAAWLIEKSSENSKGVINTTHQYIAEELASSREVISRLLKDFEQDGLIELGRGNIRVVDENALKLIVE